MEVEVEVEVVVYMLLICIEEYVSMYILHACGCICHDCDVQVYVCMYTCIVFCIL